MKAVYLLNYLKRFILLVCLMGLLVSCKNGSPEDIIQPPTASFTVTNDGCTAPCAPTFTSTSQNATSFVWEIDGSQVSTDASFSRQFTTAGTYAIKLTATNKAGSNSSQKTITVNKPGTPVADFGFTGGDCMAPCEVSFTHKATGTITSYLWDFGDKTPTSTEVNPKHTYQQGGTFTVTLTVSGPGGSSQPKTQLVTIKTGMTTGIPTIVWDKTFGGNADDYLSSMLATSDGGFLLGGSSDSDKEGNKSDPYRGSSDMWVVKIDRNGTKVWDKTFGGTGADNISSMLATSDGGFLLGGSSSSGQTGNKSDPNQFGAEDYWVVKIDGSGNKLWDKTFGSRSSDKLSAMVATSDGGFLLGGTTGQFQDGNKAAPTKGGFFDYWVVKIDRNGTKVWDKTFGGNADDYLSSMLATSDGGFLLGGSSPSDQTGDKSEPSIGMGARDYWVVKIDGSGNKVWDKTFGGNRHDNIYSMVATSDGGFLLGGLSESGQTGNKSDPNQFGAEDYWVVKIDGNGTKVWDKTFGGSGGELIYSMVATSDGGFLLGGPSNSDKDGNKSDPKQGDTDYWVVKIDRSGNKLWDKTFGGRSSDYLFSMLATSDSGYLLGVILTQAAMGISPLMPLEVKITGLLKSTSETESAFLSIIDWIYCARLLLQQKRETQSVSLFCCKSGDFSETDHLIPKSAD
ncbi:PKD domain-containing protein [Spirosoma aureum]|uniref:PKD domain-containing protein n=1 Tax=Spirosoma aureum TaxID=2692134 RepID=A0A6G9AVJ1_9BACT|nr:PKD domain-containing protein [Spirosoma aureum]QIP16492.1 PKD domain-containing protein [Spirosoma aureum]